ncbi:unnamed protein product [Cladocopium goreaui]|uniref:Ankyrin-1 n=1 Tax=Cladocopium goreaui TaxID=2562237 RepID=A0A9P1FH48_9DINO|nr:unnamed protein product [Cladocopium goreaui]
MGNQCSGSAHVANSQPVHQQQFPMYVLKVSDFLAMEGSPVPHQRLMERQLLQAWEPGMFSIFISHQWIGSTHPDPEGQQLAVLRSCLRRLIDGTIQVEEDLVSLSLGSRSLQPETRKLIAGGYIFLDWFAIPQITARLEGTNESATGSDAAKAVQSIPAYVEVADLFIALVPEMMHSDTKLPCNFTSWLSRGWCRAELWCHLLSNKPDTRVILIFSDREAEYMSALNWQQNTIAQGDFTVEKDRAVVVKLGEAAVESKIQHLSREGPLSHCRFYLAQRPKLLGQERIRFELNKFLSHFRFSSLKDAVGVVEGMTPLLCAVFAEDVDLVRLLAQNQADVNLRLRGLSQLGYFEGQTPLMVAAKSYQRAEMLSTLLELRADISAQSGAGINVAYLVRTPEQVQVLLKFRADLDSPCHNGLTPLTGVASLANPETVKALLAARCDPNPQHVPGQGLSYTPCFGAALFSKNNRHGAENMRLLIEHRADINVRARPQGLLKFVCQSLRAYVELLGSECRSKHVVYLANFPGMSPMSVAAMVGNEEMTKILWDAGAENMPNDRGFMPEDLATLNGHRHLLPMISTFHS